MSLEFLSVNVIKATILIFSLLLPSQYAYGQKNSQPFEFRFENKTLKGLIETPKNKEPSAIIIIIPGYGRTDFVKANRYSDLRNKFTALGLAVCFWDKMGCGNSDGDFNPDQPVQNSAAEALAAIAELKKQRSLKSLNIGLWGISRAGWICPLVIEKYPIKFWISASGTDDKENYGYLLKTNLLIHGNSEENAQYLYDAWKKGHRLFCTGGSFESYEEAVAPLEQDTLCRRLFGYRKTIEISKTSKKEYYSLQKIYTASGSFDEDSGLWTYIPDFHRTLSNVSCPVLAIFGENDSQVDWRKTKNLYEQTIGKHSKGGLTIKTLPGCNHNIQKCKTCAYMEDLKEYGWQPCDKYYETMSDWLRTKAIIN